MNHIELTIQKLEETAEGLEREASAYRDAARLLSGLESSGVSLPLTPALSPGRGNGAVPSRVELVPQVKAARPRGPAVRGGMLELIEVVRGLGEPFTRRDVMQAAGTQDVKRIGNFLHRYSLRGVVKKHPNGWLRGPKFPAAAQAPMKKEKGAISGTRQEPRPTGVTTPLRGPLLKEERESKGNGKIPEPSERERKYREMRDGMGKIHVPRIGEGMRPDGEEEA